MKSRSVGCPEAAMNEGRIRAEEVSLPSEVLLHPLKADIAAARYLVQGIRAATHVRCPRELPPKETSILLTDLT